MAGQHRAGRARFFRRPARGNPNQPDGRHSPEYVERHRAGFLTKYGQPGSGMEALGAAGRQSLAQLRADEPERGDRWSRRK